jgi:hypothetical protein
MLLNSTPSSRIFYRGEKRIKPLLNKLKEEYFKIPPLKLMS